MLIEEAFLALLAERHLQTITVGQIAQRARINRGTFYDHFDDKYALFDHIIRKTFQETVSRQGLTACEFTPDNVRGLIAATVEYFLYLNKACPPTERQFRPIAEGQVQAVLYETFYGWLATRPDRHLVAGYLSWAIFGTCLQQVGSGESAEIAQLKAAVHQLTQAVLQP